MRAWDLNSTRICNRLNNLPRWSLSFGLVSRLGDGIFWYVLMLSLPVLYGSEGLHAGLVMAVAGLSCTITYKLLKHRIARPRPCDVSKDLFLTTAPLDTFSFPSGHTLHAICFTLIACSFAPALTFLLYPFTILVALSRMVLGLHYPSDVVAGALIGAGIASLAIPFL